jgi:uncharacterized membrane protein YoaK (UPF0700 family)
LKPASPSPRLSSTKLFVALGLTFCAGFVDIVGFLTVYQVFTAHITGTSVHMAEQLIKGKWAEAALGAIVVGAFLLASVLGRVVIELGARVGIKRIASIAFSIEALLIAFVWPVQSLARSSGSPHTAVSVALVMLAAAMGLQTAALTRVGPLTVHTTFVTGMLNRLAEVVTGMIFRSQDLHRAITNSTREEHRLKLVGELRESSFLCAIWLLYVAGAASGTALAELWNAKALYVPVCVLLAAITVDQYRPLLLDEEREQLQE